MNDMLGRKHERNMDKKALKMIIDFLNLIFGKSKQSDFFWEEILIKRCQEKFDLVAAETYYEHYDTFMGPHEEHDADEQHHHHHDHADIFGREHSNLNALFFAIIELIGLRYKGQYDEDD